MQDMFRYGAVINVLVTINALRTFLEMVPAITVFWGSMHLFTGVAASTGHIVFTIMDVTFSFFPDEVITGGMGMARKAGVNKIRFFAEEMPVQQASSCDIWSADMTGATTPLVTGEALLFKNFFF